VQHSQDINPAAHCFVNKDCAVLVVSDPELHVQKANILPLMPVLTALSP
jgi:hypothetical protein